jgi:hypothetical protein
LWREVPDGYEVHDFLDYNPSKEKVDAERAAAAERQRRGRERQRLSRRDSRVTHAHVTDGVTEGVTVVPTRPDPTQEKTSSSPSRKRGSQAPDIFPITDAMTAWGREHCPLVADPLAQTRQFLDHHRAKGSVFKDWQAAWRTWMRNAQRFAERDQPKLTDDSDPSTAYLRETW